MRGFVDYLIPVRRREFRHCANVSSVWTQKLTFPAVLTNSFIVTSLMPWVITRQP
nr:MAG TPA: hypothetical protein [Caudoviricetes sp.]